VCPVGGWHYCAKPWPLDLLSSLRRFVSFSQMPGKYLEFKRDSRPPPHHSKSIKLVVTQRTAKRHADKRAMYVQRNTDARSRNHCCRGKAVSVIYSESVSVALAIHHARCMRRSILSSTAYLAIHYFTSHRRHEFRKKVVEHKMCVLIFSTSFVCNASHSMARYCHKCP
jgi:hypothetical protein